jgi:hypothetical protein
MWMMKNTIVWDVVPIIHSFIHSFIHQCLYSPFFGPWPLLQFRDLFTQTVGLLGRVIGPSQGLYLYTGQNKHRINAHTNIHASSRIRTFDTRVGASEDSSCRRSLGYRDRHVVTLIFHLTVSVSRELDATIFRVSYWSCTPMNEVAYSFWTSLNIYQTAWCHIIQVTYTLSRKHYLRNILCILEFPSGVWIPEVCCKIEFRESLMTT